jgi:hypothetical protein
VCFGFKHDVYLCGKEFFFYNIKTANSFFSFLPPFFDRGLSLFEKIPIGVFFNSYDTWQSGNPLKKNNKKKWQHKKQVKRRRRILGF